MELEDLAIFRTVVHEGGFTGAARLLGLTKQSVQKVLIIIHGTPIYRPDIRW